MPLAEATAEVCGGKAGPLGALLRAGHPVPDGFVVPFAVHRAAVGDLVRRFLEGDPPEAVRTEVEGRPLPRPVADALERALEGLGHPAVAVRSSAADEDADETSAAGRYESVLAVRGGADVADAVRVCWASLYSSRATSHRSHAGDNGPRATVPDMAVIAQRHVYAEVSGVSFTPEHPDRPTVIEASWGLGPSVVAGTVTPDAYRVHPDGTVTCVVADKPSRLDRIGSRVVLREVSAASRRRRTLDDATATGLATLCGTVAARLGAPQDIEWAIADGRIWLLQARPVTAAPLTAPPPGTTGGPVTLSGAPGSRGRATGAARLVRGPQDFVRVQSGDILVCPYTDPAWTPLLRIAGGVITETGGALSHAAIIARERRIPAVLGVPGATSVITDGTVLTIDGAAGTVLTTETEPPPPV